MNPVDRVLELLDMEAAECPESWMQEGLDEIRRQLAQGTSSAEWYAVRTRLLEDFFRNEGKDLPIAATFWNILANGHRSPSEPPIYDHILAEKDHRIKELDREVSVARNLASLAKGIVDEQAARIGQLETWLVEERSRGNHYGISYEDLAENREIERWIIDGEKDVPKSYLELMRKEAREQLRSEGKL